MDATIQITPGLRCRCGRLITSADDIGKIDDHVEPWWEAGRLHPVDFSVTRREVVCVSCAPPDPAEMLGE